MIEVEPIHSLSLSLSLSLSAVASWLSFLLPPSVLGGCGGLVEREERGERREERGERREERGEEID